MNTEFLAGLLVARMLEGVRLPLARPWLPANRAGCDRWVQRYQGLPAEDFVLGKLTAEAGFGVILSRNIVEHRIGSQSLRANAAHRLRLGPQHTEVATVGICGTDFYLPLAPGVADLCAGSALVAAAVRGNWRFRARRRGVRLFGFLVQSRIGC